MSPPGFLRFLTTDAQVVGIVTWIGLLVTFAGFWIAISQIRKVHTSTSAANEAVSQLIAVVRSQEQSARIKDAVGHLTSAQLMMKQNNAEATAAYLSAGWTSLIIARELSVDAHDRMQISEFVLSARTLLDEVNAPAITRSTPAKIQAQRHAEVNRVLNGLGVLSARLTTKLSRIGSEA